MSVWVVDWELVRTGLTGAAVLVSIGSVWVSLRSSSRQRKHQAELQKQQQDFQKSLVEKQQAREEGTVVVKVRRGYAKQDRGDFLLVSVITSFINTGILPVTISSLLLRVYANEGEYDVPIIISELPILLDFYGAEKTIQILHKRIKTPLEDIKRYPIQVFARDTIDKEYFSGVIMPDKDKL